MRLIHHPDAEEELIEAAQFYERRVPTLGARFLDAADAAIAAILDAPYRWSIIEEDIRHYLMPRFPFAIYYRLLHDEIRFWLSSATAVTPTTGATVFPIEQSPDHLLAGRVPGPPFFTAGKPPRRL
jgi:hypothetical protein